MFRPFHGPELDGVYERVMADETGRRLLREGRSLHPVLLDFDRLTSLPEGTLGREYARFMAENGIDIVSFAEASLRYVAREDYASGEAWHLVNRARDIHELIHVVSGYGTDELGEMCVLAFSYHEATRPGAGRLAIRARVAEFRRRGFDHTEEIIARAFERGRAARSMLAADWAELLPWPLDRVREHLGVSDPEPYEPIPATGEPPTPIDALRALFRGSRGLEFS